MAQPSDSRYVAQDYFKQRNGRGSSSPLMALSGQSSCARVCPLLDQSGQRWILARDGLSAYDP
jgi:hypothetical protein